MVPFCVDKKNIKKRRKTMKKKKVKIKLTIKDKNRLPSEFISDADDKSKKK